MPLRQSGQHALAAGLALALLLCPIAAEPQAPAGMMEMLPHVVDNSLGMRLVLVVPRHAPTAHDRAGGGWRGGFDRPIYMGMYEVTHGEFQAFIAAERAAGSAQGELDAPSAAESSADPDEPLLGAPGLPPTTSRHPAQFVSWGRAHSFTEWGY